MSHMSDTKNSFKLKNITFHRKFTKRLNPYVVSDVSFWIFILYGFKYIIAALIPISIYRIDQAIGKSIEGGDRGGVINSLYMFILFSVRSADAVPIESEIKIETMYVLVLFIFLMLFM